MYLALLQESTCDIITIAFKTSNQLKNKRNFKKEKKRNSTT